MKKVMLALCFMFGGVVTLMAQEQRQQQEQQDTTSNQYRTETQSQYPQDAQSLDQDRERIQSTELPDEVKRALEGPEYRGWLVSGAFKAKGSSMKSDTTSTDPDQRGNNNAAGAQDEEVYIVELKNGAETKAVRFDASGQIIEGMEGQDQNMQGQGQDQGQQQNQGQGQDQNRSNQDNQNDEMNQTDTTNQASPEGQNDQNQRESDQYNQSGQPDQTDPEQSPEAETEQSPESETEQSPDSETEQSTDTETDTETPSEQSTSESQTDRP